MSNGGRYYEPWNCRIRGVPGLEEITGFYHYGIKAGMGKNFFKDNATITILGRGGEHTDVPCRVDFFRV